MASLSTAGIAREEAEQRIRAIAAQLAERYGVPNPIEGMELRTRVYDDPRLTMAAAAAVERELLAGMLALVSACLDARPAKK